MEHIFVLLFGTFHRGGLQKKSHWQKARSCENAVPSVFPWSTNCKESSERTLRAKAREDSAVRPFVVSSEIKSTSRSSEAVDTSETGKPKDDLGGKPLVPERDLVAENSELTQKLYLCKFGLERFGSNDDDIFFLHWI